MRLDVNVKRVHETDDVFQLNLYRDDVLIRSVVATGKPKAKIVLQKWGLRVRVPWGTLSKDFNSWSHALYGLDSP